MQGMRNPDGCPEHTWPKTRTHPTINTSPSIYKLQCLSRTQSASHIRTNRRNWVSCLAASFPPSLAATTARPSGRNHPFYVAIDTRHPTPNTMASTGRESFKLPDPPPPLHTRDNSMDRPGTPAEAFMSPQQTPQGSPSKHHQPPGAFDLPHVFENAMRLLPTVGSPSKTKPGSPTSPNKLKLGGGDDADHNAHDSTTLTQGSPTRKSNQENTPPSGRPGMQKEPSYLTQAAQSRQEPYRTRGADQSTRYLNGPQRLSPEDLEKARKPAVKRLANVTQLCTGFAS